MEKIRDYDGKSEAEARRIQEIVRHLGQMTAYPVMEQPLNRWDSEGTYLERD